MINLDKIFISCGEFGNYITYYYDNSGYHVLLWMGSCAGMPLSTPAIKDLSLNDYSGFGVLITAANHVNFNIKTMNDIFGFDLSKFKPSMAANEGYMVPKEYLIKILMKIGAIPSIPDDAGDGE